MTHREARRKVGSRSTRRAGTKNVKSRAGTKNLKLAVRPAVRVRAVLKKAATANVR